ncbi:hypothetical protein DVR12_22455 [Chitinophaga silvatica]|uniref:Uncharacterized protein n=1 Tax=Chitinophaga silvatica TaxID=2282649 RepID=A0A3E1Y581_9BACT|nr:hypothetical protein [Chitinophaga silvatica]RFS19855.1 hypothetical protein DVR12_22455 [Chitinophaga silvatica]
MIFFLFPLLLAQGSPNAQIKAIRDKVTYTNAHLPAYKHKEVEHPEGISTEGGDYTAYWSNDSLRLIIDKTYGEMGQELVHYYFDNGMPVFVYIIRYSYTVPLYDKQFSLKNSKREETRFYLDNYALIRYIDEKGVILPGDKSMQENILTEVKDLLSFFYKNTAAIK